MIYDTVEAPSRIIWQWDGRSTAANRAAGFDFVVRRNISGSVLVKWNNATAAAIVGAFVLGFG